MKQLGNLALVCAKRPDTMLIIDSPTVILHVNRSPVWIAQWEDDEEIERMIRELNFGKFKKEGV